MQSLQNQLPLGGLFILPLGGLLTITVYTNIFLFTLFTFFYLCILNALCYYLRSYELSMLRIVDLGSLLSWHVTHYVQQMLVCVLIFILATSVNYVVIWLVDCSMKSLSASVIGIEQISSIFAATSSALISRQ